MSKKLGVILATAAVVLVIGSLVWGIGAMLLRSAAYRPDLNNLLQEKFWSADVSNLTLSATADDGSTIEYIERGSNNTLKITLNNLPSLVR